MIEPNHAEGLDLPVKLDYTYYPFAATERDYPRLFTERPSLIVSRSEDLSGKLITTLKNIVEIGEIPVGIYNEPEESVLVYNTIVDVLKSIGDRRLSLKTAIAYSKTASKNLEKEKDEVLVAIANKLGFHARLERVNPPCLPLVVELKRGSRLEFSPHPFAVPVAEYLSVVTRRLMHDYAYSLVNNIVEGGLVYLPRHVFKRVLEELVLQRVVRAIEGASPPKGAEYEKLVEEIKSTLAKFYEQLVAAGTSPPIVTASSEAEGGKAELVAENLFPPCIKRIIGILEAGGNPSHVERFNLAAFLGNIGLGVEEILDYFRKTADFDERISRYQVEHIMGLRGGKRRYKPYNCEKMKATGICPIGEQCAGGKNPLAVYNFNLKSARQAPSRDKGTEKPGVKAAGGI